MSMVHLDGLEVTVTKRFRQKTKRVILQGPTSPTPPLLTYRTPVFESDRMEILRQPERKNHGWGELGRKAVQYTTVNAYVAVRIVDAGPLTGQGGQLQGSLVASKGTGSSAYLEGQQLVPIPVAGGGTYTPGAIVPSVRLESFVNGAELNLPVLVEPWAVSDQVYVQTQLTIEVESGVIIPPPVNPLIVVDFEVVITAAGLQVGI
jgi:hypothetical protein